jgi:hypothetical protein
MQDLIRVLGVSWTFCLLTAVKTQVSSLRNCHILGIIKLKNMVKLSNYSKPYLYWRLKCS